MNTLDSSVLNYKPNVEQILGSYFSHFYSRTQLRLLKDFQLKQFARFVWPRNLQLNHVLQDYFNITNKQANSSWDQANVWFGKN
jgi:hypothetical protein